MSKYGSISLKSAMLLEMKEVTDVLDKYQVEPEDRETVTGALKEAYYQLCTLNASACHFEEMVLQMLDEENKAKLLRLFVHTHMPYEIQKMRETFAWYDDEPEGFEDEEDDEEEEGEE